MNQSEKNIPDLVIRVHFFFLKWLKAFLKSNQYISFCVESQSTILARFYKHRPNRQHSIVFLNNTSRTEEKGGEKMNKKFLVMLVALLAVAISAAPVLAIGPWGGAEANDNENLRVLGNAVLNFRGDGKPMGFNAWIIGATGNWVEWRFRDAQYAKGLANSALVAHFENVNPTFMGGEENQNTWIYLSGDGAGKPDQYQFPAGPLNALGSHGTLWWFIYFVMGANPASAGLATVLATGFPAGAFYSYNIVLSPK